MQARRQRDRRHPDRATGVRAPGPTGGDVPDGGPRRRPDLREDAGMATAEYAMATLAACGFAGLLIALLRSDEVRQLLFGIVRQGLSLA